MLKYLSGCIRETWAFSMHGSAARGIVIPFAPLRSARVHPPLPCRALPSSPRFPPASFNPLLTLAVVVPSRPRRSSHRYAAGIRPSPLALQQCCADTRVHVAGAYREPETKFSTTSPPSMLPITRCSRDEIERPRRFSAPAAAILRRIWKRQKGVRWMERERGWRGTRGEMHLFTF